MTPTERQRANELRGLLDKLAGYTATESIDGDLSAADTVCGAASAMIGRLLDALDDAEERVQLAEDRADYFASTRDHG